VNSKEYIIFGNVEFSSAGRRFNSRLAQAGFSGDVTLGSSLEFGVHLMVLCFKNPRLRQAAKRYGT
jgi:hypothetical protein